MIILSGRSFTKYKNVNISAFGFDEAGVAQRTNVYHGCSLDRCPEQISLLD